MSEPTPVPNKALTLQAIKDLLKPMDDRITKVLYTEVELKETIGVATNLKSENEKLKQKVLLMEEHTFLTNDKYAVK